MIVVYILLGIIALVLILGLIAPKDFELNRTIEIKRPVSEVYNYLKYIKNQDEWSPWKKKDPDMKQSFEGTDGQPGFVSKWEGNKHVGMGEQELISLEENKEVISELRFLKPWKSQSDAYLRVSPTSENRTNVTWGFSGRNKFPFNAMMLFMSMEKSVGKDFEEGLASLKEVLENE